jgi:hypothetical protein
MPLSDKVGPRPGCTELAFVRCGTEPGSVYPPLRVAALETLRDSSPNDSTEAQVDLLCYKVIAILQIVENPSHPMPLGTRHARGRT